MYSSNSEDSDSDSGNFKRRAKVSKEEKVKSPRKRERTPENRRVRSYNDEHRAKLEQPRRDERNGERRDRKSPERKDSQHHHSNPSRRHSSKDHRSKSRDRHDVFRRHRSKPAEARKVDDIKKKRSRSIEIVKSRGASPHQRKTEPKRESHQLAEPIEKKDRRDSNRATGSSSRDCRPPNSSSSTSKDDKKSRSSSKNSNESMKHSRTSSNEIAASYGPALPPPSSKKTFEDEPMSAAPSSKRHSSSPKARKANIGPSLPADYQAMLAMREVQPENYDNITSDEDDCMIGPLPTSAEMSERDLELEKRKIELKLQQLDRRMQAVTNPDIKHREEWMLELPEIRKIPDMGLGTRQFRKNDRPDFSDRTSWTTTPIDDPNKKNHHIDKKKSDDDKKRDLERRRDDEQEKMAKDHKKTHKRDKSLLEIHEKKLKKELKRKLKEEKDKKPERRPFNRDSDLSANKFDEAKKKHALKKASLLDSRFSSGNKKYL